MPRARSLRSLTISRRRNTSPGPPSPTFSETTNASAMNFGPDGPEKIITRADLKASVQAYDDVRAHRAPRPPSPVPLSNPSDPPALAPALPQILAKCAAYRAALMAMSRATAAFADAMEVCATYVLRVAPSCAHADVSPAQTKGPQLRGQHPSSGCVWSPPSHGQPLARHGACFLSPYSLREREID